MANQGAKGLSLQERVRNAYTEMAPAERRVADLILHLPGGIYGYSASELAALAKTSKAAVSRFVRRLGFGSFEEMRLLAREESENGSPVALMNRAGRETHGSPSLAGHFETAERNLNGTLAALDLEMWSELVEAAATAPRLWINGYRHAHHIAGYLRWSMIHLRDGVRQFPGPGETLGESLVDASKGDLAILFALRRRVPATAMLVQELARMGVRVALITDMGMTDTAGAEFVVRCQSHTHGATDDHTSAFVLAHALIENVILRLEDSARQRLRQVDERHEQLNEFG
jgi:DNA-binding MurR/RpiR family transcriptional regulator